MPIACTKIKVIKAQRNIPKYSSLCRGARKHPFVGPFFAKPLSHFLPVLNSARQDFKQETNTKSRKVCQHPDPHHVSMVVGGRDNYDLSLQIQNEAKGGAQDS